MSPSFTEPRQEILFQLPVAVTLVSSALLSLAVHALSVSKRGKIALPVTLNDPLEPRHDPFDVTSPEGIVDGEPTDETSFWLNVRSLIHMSTRTNSSRCPSMYKKGNHPFGCLRKTRKSMSTRQCNASMRQRRGLKWQQYIKAE